MTQQKEKTKPEKRPQLRCRQKSKIETRRKKNRAQPKNLTRRQGESLPNFLRQPITTDMSVPSSPTLIRHRGLHLCFFWALPQSRIQLPCIRNSPDSSVEDTPRRTTRDSGRGEARKGKEKKKIDTRSQGEQGGLVVRRPKCQNHCNPNPPIQAQQLSNLSNLTGRSVHQTNAESVRLCFDVHLSERRVSQNSLKPILQASISRQDLVLVAVSIRTHPHLSFSQSCPDLVLGLPQNEGQTAEWY